MLRDVSELFQAAYEYNAAGSANPNEPHKTLQQRCNTFLPLVDIYSPTHYAQSCTYCAHCLSSIQNRNATQCTADQLHHKGIRQAADGRRARQTQTAGYRPDHSHSRSRAPQCSGDFNVDVLSSADDRGQVRAGAAEAMAGRRGGGATEMTSTRSDTERRKQESIM